MLALVLGLAAPAGADAATAVPIGTGVSPNVVLDGAGTAYIAWNGDEVQNSTIRFCRLPRGAAACSVATTISDTAHNSLSRPFLYVSGTTVRIVQYRYGADPGLFEFSSLNGGGMFGPARKVGTAVFDDAVVGPGVTLSGVTNAQPGGTFFQNVKVDGAGAAVTTEANLSADHPHAGAIALLGGLPFVVYDNGSALAQFRRYDAGDPNVAANWTSAVDIGYADSPSLASGPLGLFMLSGTQTNAMTVRRFDGTTFAAPVQVLPSGEDIHSWLAQDPAARLHAVIPQGAADGIHLVHATSDDGAAWHSGTMLVQTDGGIFDVRSTVGRRPRRRSGLVDERHHRSARRDQGDPRSGDRARRARLRGPTEGRAPESVEAAGQSGPSRERQRARRGQGRAATPSRGEPVTRVPRHGPSALQARQARDRRQDRRSDPDMRLPSQAAAHRVQDQGGPQAPR